MNTIGIPLGQEPDARERELADLQFQLSAVNIVPLDHKISGEVPVSELRRGRRVASDDNVGLATLVEVDGVWFWQEGIITRGVAGRRASAGLVTLFGASPLTTVKFEKLGCNQIAARLQGFDEQLFTPNLGLRELKNGNLVPSAKPVKNGRILLFIHGTFSNNDKLIAELASVPDGQKLLADVGGSSLNYDQVLTFDHHTVSRSPVLNALELARVMVESDADVDIICHSRGGLVVRWFMEIFDKKHRGRRRAILVGSPLGGTSLAAPDRIRSGINLLTNLGKEFGQGLSLIPFTQAAGCLMQIVFSLGNIASKMPMVDAAVSMIPGLAGMSRVANNWELNALKDLPSDTCQYFAVTGIFKPKDVGWKVWKIFCDFEQRAAGAADSLIFRDGDGVPCSNDLVVDTTSMTEYGLPPNPCVCRFEENEHIYHTIYFRQPKTIDFIRSSFGIRSS